MAGEKEQLGHVDVTSGTLFVFDFGLIAAFKAAGSAKAAATAAFEMGKAMVPVHDYVHAIMVRGIKPGRYPVWCERLGEGEFPDLRRTVTIELASDARPAARTVDLGELPVDCARLGVFDVDAIDHWNHDRSVDGLADTVFWGADDEKVAKLFEAPQIKEGLFGFVDRPFDEALAIAERLRELRQSGKFRFAFDFRPHTDDFFILAQMRTPPAEAGILEVGGRTVCGFMTTWGDGYFPTTLELDADGNPLRCVVFFATPKNIKILRTLNGL